LARQSDIGLTSLARTLFERVQNIDGIVVLGDVDNPMFGSGMDTDLLNTGSNNLHCFPVSRHQALLHAAELVNCSPSCPLGKSSNVFERRSQPANHLVDYGPIYTYLYISGKFGCAFNANHRSLLDPQ
jgi:hypothetical protein